MKKLLLSIISLHILLFVHAQECSRSGNFVSDGRYTLTGSATIEVIDQKLVLSFSNDFFTDDGPDLDVYLSHTFGVSSSSLRIRALDSVAGAQVYEIPTGFGINQYDFVNVHCTQYNHLWGSAELGDPVGDCSTFLDDSSWNNNAELIAFPIPTSSQLNFSKPVINGRIEVFGIEGKLYKNLQPNGALIHSIDLSDLPDGLFYLRITDVLGNRLLSKRIMKQ